MDGKEIKECLLAMDRCPPYFGSFGKPNPGLKPEYQCTVQYKAEYPNVNAKCVKCWKVFAGLSESELIRLEKQWKKTLPMKIYHMATEALSLPKISEMKIIEE